MPYLRLKYKRSGESLEFERDEIRIGRNPDFELVVEGAESQVVSGSHARIFHRDGTWRVEDLGSRNGTFLGDKRLIPGGSAPLSKGAEIALGEKGPRYVVDAVAKRLIAETVVEGPQARPSAKTMPMEALGEATQPMAGLPPASPPPPPGWKEQKGQKAREVPAPSASPAPSAPKPPPPLHVILSDARTGDRFEGKGERIRIGRGNDCELRPVQPGDTSVSRVHADISRRSDGVVVLQDMGSRNGTIVNGRMLVSEQPIRQGDRIQLGDTGPELVVDRLVVSGVAVKAAAAAPAAPAKAPKPVPRRSYGGKGKTVFFKEMFEETERKTTKRVRVIVWSFVGLVVVVAGGMYGYSEYRTRRALATLQAQQAAALGEQQRVADSIRQAAQADLDRLRADLTSARESSAPASVVESLRTQLEAADRRTSSLAAALNRAQSALDAQIAAGDSVRQAAQADLRRLQAQLAQAGGAASSRMMDSLRQAIAAAQQRQQEIEDRLRATQGVDLPSISQANQGAVGLVTSYFPTGIGDATGFALTASGYFVTNRHAVWEDGANADSVFVTMADQNFMRRADIVRVAAASGPDLALIKIRGYSGQHVRSVDWSGTHVRQGEPAALIGFPEGMALALDESRTVRTSMSAGIFSKVTADGVQFDGFTVGGSSGSPILNASGEVVAVHRAGLRAGPGLSLAVPVTKLIPLLPLEVRREAGLN